jgi:hypothetical protein
MQTKRADYSRRSPTESATKFPVGTKKRGNDGNMWIIVKNKNGIHRWIKVKVKVGPSLSSSSSSSRSSRRKIKTLKKHKKSSSMAMAMAMADSLKSFWENLSSGKIIIVIDSKGNDKYVKLPSNRKAAIMKLKMYTEDPTIIAVLTSNMSYEAFEKLQKKAIKYGHNKPKDIIKHYKKYFRTLKPYTDSMDSKLYYPF